MKTLYKARTMICAVLLLPCMAACGPALSSVQETAIPQGSISVARAETQDTLEKTNTSNEPKETPKMRIKQTAGRDALGDFAPDFAHYNDDILFGENWNSQDIDLKTRSMVTVVALMSSGITDSSLIYHLENAKKNGITKTEIAGIITHVAFYVGWPKAWAVFRLAKDIWNGDESGSTTAAKDAMTAHAAATFFPIGEPNDAYAAYFTGQSYLAPVLAGTTPIYNVTFEPKCRNNWHVHHADKGGGQILVAVGGRGYYQEWGKPAIMLEPGSSVNIPAGVKHCHGAAPDTWFSHLAIEVPGENARNEWLEPVTDDVYGLLK